jgi:hypothetical protein
MDLYPTPTRVNLLRDVDEGRVFTDVTAEHDRVVLVPNAPTEWQTQRLVTVRMAEVERAGWVEEYDAAMWRLTDKGREILAGAS